MAIGGDAWRRGLDAEAQGENDLQHIARAQGRQRGAMHQQELDRQVDGNVRVGGLTLHRDLPGGPTSQLRRGGAHDMGELPGLRGHPGNRAPRHVPPEVRGLVARREAEANQRRREALGLENGRLNIQEATVHHTRASRPVSTTVPHLHSSFFFIVLPTGGPLGASGMDPAGIHRELSVAGGLPTTLALLMGRP